MYPDALASNHLAGHARSRILDPTADLNLHVSTEPQDSPFILHKTLSTVRLLFGGKSAQVVLNFVEADRSIVSPTSQATSGSQ